MTNELRRPQAGALLLLFLLSGATSLVYQVLWVRQLSLVLGSTLHAISAVVAAFMAGLALGSAWLGARADRGPSPLLLYALLEAGIGVCGLLLPFFFDALGSARWAASGSLAFVAGFAALLVPTLLMGGTLPVLARYVAGFQGSRGPLIGALYALNTAGAIAGAAVAGFVLIRALGLRNTTHVVVLGNFVVFALAAALSRRWPGEPPTEVETPRQVRQHEVQLLRPVTVVYFVSGLVGLALEVLWTRAVLLLSGNTIYAFTIILTTFLLGIALGSSWMAAGMRRARNAPVLLAAFQCLIGLIAGLSPLILAAVAVPLFRDVQERTAPLGLAAQALSAYVAAALFMLPATLLMGASFPLVARVVADHTAAVGRAVGRVYALNTLGAVLGSLSASLVFVPWLGIQRSILLFALASAGTGLYLAVRAGSRSWTRLGAGAVVVLVFALVLSPNQFRSMLERMLRLRLTFYEEGVETTVGVYDSRRAGRPVLLINNVALDDHGVVHKMLAHLPALLHPAPRRGLVLGFGVGISSQSLASHGLEVNDCVEISPEVMRAAGSFAALNGGIASRGDPRFRLHLADGRRFLLANREPYDLIALDANSGKLRNAGVGKLYTREFFELCRDRLGPDGLVTAYVSPNSTLREFKMIVRTFSEVFPNTTLWLDPVFGETCVLLGSKHRLLVDLNVWMERLQNPAVRADLASFELDQPGALLGSFILGEDQVRLFARDGEVNTDDRPIMEFYALDMDPFEVDDHPLSDGNLPLHIESILPRLETRGGTPAARAMLDYVAAQESAGPALQNAWQALRWQQNAEAGQWLRLAASLHPEAEHLRALLGYGRSIERQAFEALRTAPSADAASRAGLVAARRGDCERGLELLQRATAEPGSGPQAQQAEMLVAAARCARGLGRLELARALLDKAAALGEPATLDLARLRLDAGDAAEAARLLAGLAPESLRRSDMKDVIETVAALRRAGAVSPPVDALEAIALETCGDYAGAWLAYERAAAAAAAARGGEAWRDRARICALRLALRCDAERQALGPGADVTAILAARWVQGSVPETALPATDFRSAAPWLQLSRLYRRTGQPLPAYWTARAARTVAPADVATYVAVGETAAQVGARLVARLAFERVVSLDGSNQMARAALRQLSRD